MKFYEWIKGLENRGSEYDPIYYNGVEMTPRELVSHFSSLDEVKNVHISYWGGIPLKLVHGTWHGHINPKDLIIIVLQLDS